MGRRCRAWDYCTRCIYSITLELQDRATPFFGELLPSLVSALKVNGACISAEEWERFASETTQDILGRVDKEWRCRWRRGVLLSEAGLIVEREWMAISETWPGVKVLDCQVMPEHFHGLIFVTREQEKPLGSIVGCFKAKVTSALRAAGLCAENVSIWKRGYVDVIIFRKGQLEREKRYYADNPRRLAMKRAFPLLFKVAREIEIVLPGCEKLRGMTGESNSAVLDRRRGVGLFSAIGNRFLLDRMIVQVQCSRAWLSYRRLPKPGGGFIVARDEYGRAIIERKTVEFDERRDELFALAKHGAVLISPCISDGERELATLALEAKFPLITMHNKGFARLQKPVGRYFDACADGRLLMLAPSAWPYQPGEKRMSRLDALVLNRLAQWIACEGAAEINYRGRICSDIDSHAVAAANVSFKFLPQSYKVFSAEPLAARRVV